MFRWDDIEEQTVFGMVVKMYRDPYESSDTFQAFNIGSELDHYAFEHLGTELHMYRILDVNFEEYIEQRGDLDRISAIKIPIQLDETRTIY